MRRLTTFSCEGATLAATLDDAPGAPDAIPPTTGLLIVTGGTQTRIGAHRGLARLAAAVAAAGFPVFRFERRGVGDSDGTDPGFADSGPDIAAASAAFRSECPGLTRMLGFGLCDGATALALHHAAAGIDGLILANPWTIDAAAGPGAHEHPEANPLPPAAAIRRRYLDRLTSLDAWKRLLTGGIDYRAALRGVAAISRRQAPPALATAMGGALTSGGRPVEIVLATRDATALAFAEAWRGPAFAGLRGGGRGGVTEIDSHSHSFATGNDPARLAALCVAALDRAGNRGEIGAAFPRRA
ncbi:hydrolase 1, exosortase A system-associated [Sphingomonas solaris]|uniref:Hydrolase 1, exosortase A system-associated n=1 Tax=Alterirhizorhabdus solaris TaxID=2529389 RepID=A0A558R6H9_9SPHN|nr:hydrolase 1, exosortase A system-associated [Sphingomonas solaris]TVV74987.1 hydrolase 1, exosortase A system-associated [Sphingomonas solaris]